MRRAYAPGYPVQSTGIYSIGEVVSFLNLYWELSQHHTEIRWFLLPSVAAHVFLRSDKPFRSKCARALSFAPLRIAYLTYRGKPHVGGQGVYTRHLTKALADLGHEVPRAARQIGRTPPAEPEARADDPEVGSPSS